MPKTKRASVVQTRLAPADQERFNRLVDAQKRPAADIMRDAIRLYLDQNDAQNAAERESLLERRLRRMEDRLAALLARLGMDIGIVYSFLWYQSDATTRSDLFNRCYKNSRDRLAGKLDVIEEEFVDLVKAKVLADEKSGGEDAKDAKKK